MAKKEESRLPVTRSWQLLLLGVAFGLALALGGPGTVSAQEGEIVADCEGASVAIDTDCEFGDGQEFTVSIQVTDAPDGGYYFFQTKLRWDEGVLDYLATNDPAQEVVWPACDVPARSDNTAGEPGRPLEPSVLFACVPFQIQATDYVGPLLLFTFVCSGQGTSTLSLVAREADPGQLGSHFLDVSSQPIDPSLSDASVTCGGAEQPRPESEVTVNPPPPFEGLTELPTQPPDGATAVGPTATPSGPTATPGATVIRTPTLRADGDADDDDGGLPVWAWTLIGLAIAAGVGGGGFVAWRRMQARGEDGEPDEPQARGEDTEPDEPS